MRHKPQALTLEGPGPWGWDGLGYNNPLPLPTPAHDPHPKKPAPSAQHGYKQVTGAASLSVAVVHSTATTGGQSACKPWPPCRAGGSGSCPTAGDSSELGSVISPGSPSSSLCSCS